MINLCNYTDIIISISGGKDSQTVLAVMMDEINRQQYGGSILAIHADTGAEWPQSVPHCQMLCRHYTIRLVVAFPYRALPLHIERRCRMLAEKGENKPGWPSAACRYCTSDCKRAPIDKVVRAHFPARGPRKRRHWRVLSVTGERRQESRHRANLLEIELHKRLTAGARTVVQYRPILDYSLEDVWAHIADSLLPRHPAYDKGNKRLSCAICVLADDNDIRNGAAERPDLAEHYLRLEREYGYTFKNGRSLADILRRHK